MPFFVERIDVKLNISEYVRSYYCDDFDRGIYLKNQICKIKYYFINTILLHLYINFQVVVVPRKIPRPFFAERHKLVYQS